MHQYISSTRYTRALEAALKRLEPVVSSQAEENQARAEWSAAHATLAAMLAELPTPGEAFDNLIRCIESRFTSLERDAWRSEKPLKPSEHSAAIAYSLGELSKFCTLVIDDEPLGVAVVKEAAAHLESTQLLERMAKSFESDGKGGEYRSDLTDTLMEELRATLGKLVSERMGLDLTREE
jgi:hypothetical protein